MSQFVADILALVFGTIAIIMTIIIEFSQLITIFKTHNTSGTSITTYLIYFAASVLWLIWASLLYAQGVVDPFVEMTALHVAGLYPALISNALGVILSACIFIFKFKHLRMCKKMNISELELSKQITLKQKNYSWWKKYWQLLVIVAITIIINVSMVLGLTLTFKDYVVSEEKAQMFKWVIFGFNLAAAIFFEAISWPQFIKSIRSKDTSGISLGWAIFLPLSCITCFCYDLFLGLTGGIQTVLASLICSGTLINLAVLVLKIINIVKAKKLGISELEYTKIYILKKRKNHKHI